MEIYYSIFKISLSNMFVLRAEGVMIRELCLQRDNDDFILSNSELSILIDDLCDNETITYVTLEHDLQLIITKCF